MFWLSFVIFPININADSLPVDKDAISARSFSLNEHKLWHNATVPYTISTQFNEEEKEYLQQQIDYFNSLTCVKFVPTEKIRTLARFDIVKAEEPTSCHTSPEYPGIRELNRYIVLAPHCLQEHWLTHEMGHALGMRHEHKRADRDCYIQVHSSRWDDPNYDIDSTIDTSFPYDKQSVMHYRRGLGTYLQPVPWAEDADEDYGSPDGRLTDLDIWKIKFQFCGEPHYCVQNPTECRQIEEFKKSHNNCTT